MHYCKSCGKNLQAEKEKTGTCPRCGAEWVRENKTGKMLIWIGILLLINAGIFLFVLFIYILLPLLLSLFLS